MIKHIILVFAVMWFGIIDCIPSELIQHSNLEYLGGFRLPSDGTHPTMWGMSGPTRGMAFRPPSTNAPYGSLIVSGAKVGNVTYVSEFSVPNPATLSKDSNYVNVGHSPLLLQEVGPATNSGVIDIYNPNKTGSPTSGGYLVVNDTLIGTLYDTYAYAPDMDRSHFKNSVSTINGSTAIGSYIPQDKTGTFTGNPLARFVAGNMCTIPTEYQTLLDGDVLTGLFSVSIITNTSFGPSAFSFWSNDIINNSNIDTPFNVTPLMYVADGETHPLYGYWTGDGPANDVWASTDNMGGVVFPKGSRSVLYFNRHGTGAQCYGSGTSDPELAGTEVIGEPGVIYCYDPLASSKGQHAYPYIYRIIAFDADDLVKVKNGTLAHNQVIPYAYWGLTFPTAPYGANIQDIQGVGYDEVNQIIYVGQSSVELGNTVFHAFKVNISASKTRYRLGAAPIIMHDD